MFLLKRLKKETIGKVTHSDFDFLLQASFHLQLLIYFSAVLPQH